VEAMNSNINVWTVESYPLFQRPIEHDLNRVLEDRDAFRDNVKHLLFYLSFRSILLSNGLWESFKLEIEITVLLIDEFILLLVKEVLVSELRVIVLIHHLLIIEQLLLFCCF
jgi:hypothetical protein